jgi:hypothetical protein|tara:strand:+ start:321 stop:539 length:219 start_codon:yes stop_codon:yes gene_type:complete
MTELFQLKDKYWISCSPLARAKDECWVVSVYKKQKVSWITEECNSFSTPEQAYEWGFNKINKLKDNDNNKGK